MKNKINIVELLKECPKGMELDCTLFDNPVKYDGLDNSNTYPIRIVAENGSYFYLTKEGYLYTIPNSKCVIFPKGKTTWKGFNPLYQFKNGDVVATSRGNWIGITTGGNIHSPIPTYCVIKGDGTFAAYLDTKPTWCFSRFATEQEKEKLFKAIKENGYKWIPETKTFEELIEPEFKIGDKITNGKISITIGYIDDKYYYEIGRNITNRLSIENQDEWKLVPNKFDINSLKPFESKVLVRHNKDSKWTGSFFSFIDRDFHSHCYKFVTTADKSYPMMIPFKGNEYLLGQTDDCQDFYKTWE